MQNKVLYAIFAISMIALLTLPMQAFAWSYGRPGVPDDLIFEQFGPHADKLLITLYTSEIAEWEQGLELGKLDVTDWPLDDTHYNRYIAPPWDTQLKVLGYGPEFGLFLFDLNNNNNQYLGNPPNPAYPNPVYPNPMSDVDLRKAVALLTNRALYIAYQGATTTTVMYTPVGPSSGKYSDTDIAPGGAREDLCYLYDPLLANQTLDAGGFPVGADGWRTWGAMPFSLKICSRVDSPPRDFSGNDIYTSLLKAGVHCTIAHMPSGAARIQVMDQKNFHIYTGGWSLTVDPDFLTLWAFDYYWHPGRPYNYAGCNDAAYNTAADGVSYANDQQEAVDNAWICQERFATEVLSVPLWISTGYKAVSRTYVGGTPEEAAAHYTGQYWSGFVNVPGYGVDSGYTFLNLHPELNETGPAQEDELSYNGNMTIRYAFKQNEIKQFNPIYAEWLWDNTVIDLIGYDSLLGRNPYNLGQFMPLVASKYSVGTYLHPLYGTCTKVVFTLRPGVEWSDGTPVTVADVYFTFVEIKNLLISRGMPYPWWWSNVQNILSFSILDAYNFEVLLDVKTVFATGWIGGCRIMPKHIWKPICTAGDPTVNNPDPNMINSGAWRLKEYVEGNYILLVANTPDTTVASTSLPGSYPVLSWEGHYRFCPLTGYVSVNDTLAAKNVPSDPTNITVTVENNRNVSMTVDLELDLAKDAVPLAGPYTATLFVPRLGKNSTTFTVVGPNAGKWQANVTATYLPWIRPSDWDFGSMFYFTIKEDIAGSTWYDDIKFTSEPYNGASYPYKNELVTPDIKVDIKDVARASGAFGSYPGHAKWNTVADITGDYKIDIKDLARISSKFGWHA
jgi:ABC-type transport system substrate-binding protein